MSVKRQRVRYGTLMLVTMISGLLSRKFASGLPGWLNDYLGDGLWALMVFFGICLLFPRSGTGKQLLLALGFCFMIEFSQLYQAEWLNQIRGTALGGLVLGHGFLWRDLVAYSIGVAVGGVIVRQINTRS